MTTNIEEPDFFDYVDSSLSCPLSKAILAKDVNTVKRILRKRKKNSAPLSADNRRWTALHVAASEDEYADCLELLLHNSDSVLLDRNAKTFEEETALYLACERGCVKNCVILLKNQCNPKLSKTDKTTPLHAATMKGHATIVSELLTRDLNLNCQDWQGYTPLHLASVHGHLKVVEMLMKNKETNISLSDLDGNMPLHLACNKGHFEIMKILLNADSSFINWRNHEGFTPLILAVQSGNIHCVKYLLDHGADADLCTGDKVIALQYAALTGNREVLVAVLRSTTMDCILNHCLYRIQDVLHASDGIFHSLLSCVMKSESAECLSVILESDLPKSVLEAPYVESEDEFFWVYSPLAYLFSTYASSNSRVVDQFLRLLLRHNITYMSEFNQAIELKSRITVLRYVNPFSDIFDADWTCVKRYHYLNELIENGITADYCLQCYIERKSTFQKFNIIDLQRFYEPVVKAIHEDNVEIVEFFIVNSAILEPVHLWNFLNFETLFTYGTRRRNVFEYLMKLRAFSSAPHCPDVRNIINITDNNSRCPLYTPYEVIRNVNLQQLCRQAIRNHLRDETIEDNLKNFKKKIDALVLPNLLKNYLLFKKR